MDRTIREIEFYYKKTPGERTEQNICAIKNYWKQTTSLSERGLPLFYVFRDSLETCQWLLEQGADINAKSNSNIAKLHGCTTLHLVVDNLGEHVEYVEQFLKLGADPNIESLQGWPLLDLVCTRELQMIILKYGGKSGFPKTWQSHLFDSVGSCIALCTPCVVCRFARDGYLPIELLRLLRAFLL